MSRTLHTGTRYQVHPYVCPSPGSAACVQHSPSHVTNEVPHDVQRINRGKLATGADSGRTLLVVVFRDASKEGAIPAVPPSGVDISPMNECHSTEK